MRSLALPQNTPGAPAGLPRSPESAEAPVEKALEDSEEAGILTAVIPKPCEALRHRLLGSHFSPQCKLTPCSPHTGEAFRWKAHGAALGVQSGRVEEEQRGLSVTSEVSECRLYPLHPTILPGLLKNRSSTMPGVCQAPGTWKRRWNLFQGIL